jgi:hypothetical protein
MTCQATPFETLRSNVMNGAWPLLNRKVIEFICRFDLRSALRLVPNRLVLARTLARHFRAFFLGLVKCRRSEARRFSCTRRDLLPGLRITDKRFQQHGIRLHQPSERAFTALPHCLVVDLDLMWV